MVMPMLVNSATIRYSDPRKYSLNSCASASSNPDKESMTTRFACIRVIILIKSCKVSSIDKSRARVLITPTCPALTSADSLLFSVLLGCRCDRFALLDNRPRENLNSGIANTEGMQTRRLGLTAHFDHLHLAHHGIAVHIL